MNGIDRRLSKTTGLVIDILVSKKLPHTYDEVFQLVRLCDGDMVKINSFIDNYQEYLLTQ